MRKKISLVLMMVLVSALTLDGTVSAQTKRRQQPKRSRASRQNSQPKITLGKLTEEQRQALANALDEAKALEITYKYDPRRYADEATRLADLWWDVSESLPDGKGKTAFIEMAAAHKNVGYLFRKLYPYRKSETREERAMRELNEASEAYDRSRGGTMAEERRRREEQDASEEIAYIAQVVENYGVQHLSPHQAQMAIFNIAVAFREILSEALARQPSSHK